MADRRILIEGLASALLAGPWSTAGMTERALHVLGAPATRPPLAALARRLERAFPDTPPRPALLAFLAADQGLAQAHLVTPFTIRRPILTSPTMTPAAGAPATWRVPTLPTPGELAAWLGLEVAELEWFAGSQGRAGRTDPGQLAHYHYHWARKSSGGYRLLEAPKARLKGLQRKLLDEILGPVPTHPAAHGFCPGRGALSYATPHVGQELVLALDLRDFFASVRAARVRAIFRTLGYPEATARLLTGLTTHAVSPAVWAGAPLPQTPDELEARFHAGRFFQTPHLPQGAPTSPALANLVAFRLDLRLAALARTAGATYTRYADDLAFSGSGRFAKGALAFFELAAQLVAEEGFRLNGRKTRILRPSVRQRLAGIVVNARPNIARHQYDELKAILHNCRRDGPAAHNRDGHADLRAHLRGRIAWVEQVHPARGRKLRAIFDAIRWPAP